MSEPVSPADPAAQAAVQSTIAAQADSVSALQYQPVAPPPGGHAAAVDTEALLAQLQEQVAKLQADAEARAAADAEAAAAAEPKPPSLAELIPNLSGTLAHVVSIIEDRLGAVEKHLGL